MLRIMSVLALVTSLWLVPAQAQATVSITIVPSRTALEVGQSVTFTGRVSGAPAGVVVRLQRLVAGSWSTVAKTKTSPTRRYRFTTLPPKGYQSYRVVMPRQAGRPSAVSPRSKLRVSWRPAMTVEWEGKMREDEVWSIWTYVYAPQLVGVALDIQRRLDDSWSSTGESVLVGTNGYAVHKFGAEPLGTQFRFRAPASGLRLAAGSPTVTIDAVAWRPTLALTKVEAVHQSIDGVHIQKTHVMGSTGVPNALVYLMTQGDLSWMTLGTGYTDGAGHFDFLAASAPDGAEVFAHLPQEGPRLQAESPPVASYLEPWPIQLDGDWFSLRPVLGTTGGLLTFEAGSGEVITFELRDPDRSTYDPITYHVLGPNGSVVAEQVRTVDQEQIRWLETPTAGTYTIALDMNDGQGFPGEVEFRASRAKKLTGTIDAMPYASTVRDHQIVEISFSANAGDGIHLPTDGPGGYCSTSSSPTVQPPGPYVELLRDGLVVPRLPFRTGWQIPATGDYTLRLFPCRHTDPSLLDHWRIDYFVQLVRTVNYTLSMPGQLTVQPGEGRWASIAFNATAGRTISFETNDYNQLFSAHVVSPNGTRIAGLEPFVAPTTGTYRLWLGPGDYNHSFMTLRGSETH